MASCSLTHFAFSLMPIALSYYLSSTITSCGVSSRAGKSHRRRQLVTVGTSGIVEIHEPNLSGVHRCVCAEQHNKLQLGSEVYVQAWQYGAVSDSSELLFFSGS